MLNKGSKVYYISEPAIVYEGTIVAWEWSAWSGMKYVVEYTYPVTRYSFTATNREIAKTTDALRRVYVSKRKLIQRD